MIINVICGGKNAEREVSLRSGNAVANALKTKNHIVKVIDTTASDIELQACDIAFPVLHGVGGEDGSFQKRLEDLNILFVGSDSKSSALCMDKSIYREFMIKKGFLMPRGSTLNLKAYLNSDFRNIPHVIKPVDGGSSIDTLFLRDTSNLDDDQIYELFNAHKEMIVEQLIEGFEITVGIIENDVLPAIEIIPPANTEFDYENKYNGKTQELCPPQNISEEIQTLAKEISMKVHKFAGCRDYSRSDFMISKDGKVYLLETNTIPGMTEQSLYPKMALTYGLSMPELADKLAKLANSRT
ncbi:MAG: D-alanine--D-alanine ligase [bacterium]|nr:D-alanine--D-alanine ligase [bacterium]